MENLNSGFPKKWFWIINDWDLILICPILAHVELSENSKNWDFPKSIVHRKLKYLCTRPVKRLNITGLFSILPVTRLSQGLFWSSLHLFTYFLAKKARHLAIFENFQESQTNILFIAQDFGPSCVFTIKLFIIIFLSQ